MTLIGVPCWWDVTSERYIRSLFSLLSFSSSFADYFFIVSSSLAATICFDRPDLDTLSTETEIPISLNPPANFFNSMSPAITITFLFIVFF